MKGRQQQQMWTAMRQLGAFTVAELRAAASTDDLILKQATVAFFVTTLHKAGALLCVTPSGNRRPGVYRLRPSLNTGPNAPVLVKGQLCDGNRGTPIGETRP